MRWTAPKHISSISLIAGRFDVARDGTIETPDDLSPGDLAGLAAHGFERVAAPVRAATPAKAPEA